MSIVEISADFTLLCKILTRIADALDRAVPPARIPMQGRKQVQPDDIVTFDERKAWEEQQREKFLASLPSEK